MHVLNSGVSLGVQHSLQHRSWLSKICLRCISIQTGSVWSRGTGRSVTLAKVKAERQLSIIGAMAQSGSSKSSSQLERLRIREDLLETYEGTPLRDVVKALECIAPLQNAGDWDNVGLLVGSMRQRIQRVLLTIDLTSAVLTEAAAANVDLIIAYHPPIFSSIKRFTKVPLVQAAASAGMCVYCPHTALDAAPGGTNCTLASQLGLTGVRVLEPSTQPQDLKLVTFVPHDQSSRVVAAMHKAGAGNIGDYMQCSFSQTGTGQFCGKAESKPSIGKPGHPESVDEARVEVVVPHDSLASVVTALQDAHPYQEVAFDVFERLPSTSPNFGMGRVGLLESPMKQAAFVQHIKDSLKLQHLMVAAPQLTLRQHLEGSKSQGGEPQEIHNVAVCAGSGSGLLDAALAANADTFVTGEMSHHDALRATAAGITVICTLHSNSERGALQSYARMITQAIPDIELTISKQDTDPYVIQ